MARSHMTTPRRSTFRSATSCRTSFTATRSAAPINGWQFSGYTTYQDGANLQASNPVFNATYNTNTAGPTFTMPGGQTSQNISPSTWFGTNEWPNALIPILTCNPSKGLSKGRNSTPTASRLRCLRRLQVTGTQGQYIWPYMRNPHYWGSDLAVFKAFKITEAQRIEARISATNWLNHPNGAFDLSGTSADDKLIFNGFSSGSGMVTNSNTTTTGAPLAKLGYRWMQFAAKYYF